MYKNSSVYIDPKTQDYANLNGQIENRNQILTEVYLRLTIPKGKYLYAKNNPDCGSFLHTIKNKRGTVNKTQLAQLVADALRPLVEQSKIKIQEIRIPILVLGSFTIEVDCIDNSGENIYFVLNPVI